jgi:adenylate cyclase
MTGRWATAATAVTIGALCGALSLVASVQELEQRFDLPWLYALRGPEPVPAAVAVVAMDQRAASKISLPRDPEKFNRCENLSIGTVPSGFVSLPEMPSRWPRCIHALAVRRLVDAGARLIVFDALFRTRPPLTGPAGDLYVWQDQELASALAESRRGLVARKLEVVGGVESLADVSEPIEAAAIGSAPFPLIANAERRVDGFIAFKETGLVTATLPVIAVQAFYEEGYGALTAALDRVAPDEALLLPETRVAFAVGGRLEATSLLMRQLAQGDRASGTKGWETALTAASGRPDESGTVLKTLTSLYDGDAMRLLNFYGPNGTIPSISYDALLGDPIPSVERIVRGRAVFLGFSEAERQEQVEHFATAVSLEGRPDLSGVEILATAFANLIDDGDLRLLPLSYSIGIAFAAAVLTFVVGMSVANAAAIAFAAILVGSYGAAALYAFAARDVLLPLVVPMWIAAPIGLASALSIKYWNAYRQREELRRAFSYFVPPQIVSLLEQNASQVATARESLECACVSTDATRYTTLAETMSPEDLTEFLNHYYEALFGGVAHQGGFVSDVIGDGMLAIWPRRSADMHTRLMAGLLEMREAAERFSEQLGGDGLPTRFGVDLGRVALTTVGAHVHYEYRAVGDAVNTSERIQELNKKLATRILISASAIGDAGGAFLLRDLGRFLLRGKTHDVHLYELLGRREDATAEQLRLCEQFAEAMAVIRTGPHAAASERFALLHDMFPDDGPTTFFGRALAVEGVFRDGAIVTS